MCLSLCLQFAYDFSFRSYRHIFGRTDNFTKTSISFGIILYLEEFNIIAHSILKIHFCDRNLHGHNSVVYALKNWKKNILYKNVFIHSILPVTNCVNKKRKKAKRAAFTWRELFAILFDCRLRNAFIWN